MEVVSEALTDNLAVVFLNKFESDQPSPKVFVEECLPPACRDWSEYGDPQQDSPIYTYILSLAATGINYGLRAGKGAYD